VLTLDTSAIVALQDRRDLMYQQAFAAIQGDPGPFILPVGILAEVDSMLTSRSPGSTSHLLGSLIDGSLLLDCGDQDPPRILELIQRYRNLRLGYADASVIACAERNGGRILTFDRRAFEVVARDVPISLVPSDTT
jgi:predicted nucleic acid-binding protein